MGMHVGRHWPSAYRAGAPQTTMEDQCPCPVEPCGCIDISKVHPECPQHAIAAAKTMRTMHDDHDCPGAAARA